MSSLPQHRTDILVSAARTHRQARRLLLLDSAPTDDTQLAHVDVVWADEKEAKMLGILLPRTWNSARGRLEVRAAQGAMVGRVDGSSNVVGTAARG